MQVGRANPVNKFPLQLTEDNQYMECPFGVKVQYPEDCTVCEPYASCSCMCENCPKVPVARINSCTCQRCVYYIQELDSQVICGHPIYKSSL